MAVVPQGGHTGLVGGATPSPAGDELVVSLERMDRIRSADPTNFSMVVEAGCVLETVQRAAERHNLIFPLSLGAQGSCQIGGNVATNAGGVNVLRYGMARDLNRVHFERHGFRGPASLSVVETNRSSTYHCHVAR